jgi:uncharacterized protein DUF6152
MTVNKAILFVSSLLLASTIASAHHSSAMFDKTQVREVTATVSEFQWTNPHVWIQVILQNDQGENEEWSVEGTGPNSLFRNGWRRNSFQPGDVIDIRFNPMRDGSHAGGFIGAKFADGHILGNWE